MCSPQKAPLVRMLLLSVLQQLDLKLSVQKKWNHITLVGQTEDSSNKVILPEGIYELNLETKNNENTRSSK
jgi:hypothetical protein